MPHRTTRFLALSFLLLLPCTPWAAPPGARLVRTTAPPPAASNPPSGNPPQPPPPPSPPPPTAGPVPDDATRRLGEALAAYAQDPRLAQADTLMRQSVASVVEIESQDSSSVKTIGGTYGPYQGRLEGIYRDLIKARSALDEMPAPPGDLADIHRLLHSCAQGLEDGVGALLDAIRENDSGALSSVSDTMLKANAKYQKAQADLEALVARIKGGPPAGGSAPVGPPPSSNPQTPFPTPAGGASDDFESQP